MPTVPSIAASSSLQASTAPTGIDLAKLAAIGHDAEDTDRPDWRDPQSMRMLDLWMRCRDAYEGTDALLANATKYIPKHPKEKPGDYRARCAHSAVFNAYGATVSGLVGLANAKPATLGDDVAPQIREHAENIDGAGTTLNNFAGELLDDGLSVGTTGFMVLYPPRPAGATAKDEQNGVLRPYWRRIQIEDIHSWDHETVGAREVLTQLVVREAVKRRKGRFGRELVTTYREFRHDVTGPLGLAEPVTYIVWEERKQEKQKRADLVPVSAGFIVNGKGAPFSRIPYVGVLFGRKVSPLFARPVFKDLLDLMLKAFRIDSDRSYLMHQACVPIPVRKGYVGRIDPTTNLPIRTTGGSAAASNVLMDFPADTPQSSGAGFSWVEIQGTAFEPTEKELEKLKAEMGAMGMSFLAPSTRAAETAEARRLDSRIENASLSSCLSVLESAIEEGLILHAEYMGIEVVRAGEQSGGSFTMNRDFEATLLSEAAIKVYSDMVLADQLTLETFLEILQNGGRLPDGFNVEDEVRKLQLLAADRLTNTPPAPDNQNGDGAPDPGTDPNADPAARDAEDPAMMAAT